MPWRVAPLLFALAALGCDARAELGPVAVDLELVLAVDVSSSVDDLEYALQIRGYADAFRDPRVAAAIRSGAAGAIAVTFLQWSGVSAMDQSIRWTRLDGAEAASGFAATIARVDRPPAVGGTSIGGAIDRAVALFERNGFDGARRVIDISGDGRNNNGRRPEFARDAAVARGITINGLPILTDDARLDTYYRQEVIGGPGAFALPAASFQDFGRAILNKLLSEIAGGVPAEAAVVASAAP